MAIPLVRFASLAPFPGLVHAVSTRHGGVSAGPFASLNLGGTVGDPRENVEANYRRLADALEIEREHLTTTWQVHSSRIVLARSQDRGTMIAKADGIITDQPGVPLIQRHADCAPVLIYDPRRHAVGVAHAGWRGTVAAVSLALVQGMSDAFGSQAEDLVAVVGPAIGPCCYQVGPEVVSAVREAFGSNGASRPETVQAEASYDLPLLSTVDGHMRFDLWEANRRHLAQAGVQAVEVAGICTRCQRDRFFSHRGDKGRTGRFAAVVMLRS